MPASELEQTRVAKFDGVWRSLFRSVVGAYWLYFAATKWTGVGWVRPLIEESPKVNPIPGFRNLLATIVVPHWVLFAVAQTAGETLVGLLLIAGLVTRAAALAATFLATGLVLVISFGVTDTGFQWLYYLAVLVSAQVVVGGPGPYALDRFRWGPAWLRIAS